MLAPKTILGEEYIEISGKKSEPWKRGDNEMELSERIKLAKELNKDLQKEVDKFKLFIETNVKIINHYADKLYRVKCFPDIDLDSLNDIVENIESNLHLLKVNVNELKENKQYLIDINTIT